MYKPVSYRFATFCGGCAVAGLSTVLSYVVSAYMGIWALHELHIMRVIVVHFNIGVSSFIGGLFAGAWDLHSAAKYRYAPRPRLLALLAAWFYAAYYSVMSWEIAVTIPALFLVDAALLIACPFFYRRAKP